MAENPAGTSFETVRVRAEDAWRKRLNQIEIDGGTPDERTVFTTALYHALMTPNIYSDANGEYRGMDGEVHHIAAGQRAQYANFSGWGRVPLATATGYMARSSNGKRHRAESAESGRAE